MKCISNQVLRNRKTVSDCNILHNTLYARVEDKQAYAFEQVKTYVFILEMWVVFVQTTYVCPGIQPMLL